MSGDIQLPIDYNDSSKIYLYNIQSSNGECIDYLDRLNYLRRVVQEASKKERAMVVAPEYFFCHGKSKFGDIAKPIPLNEDEKKSVEMILTSLSRCCPNVLIIPGTIAWLKPLEDEKFYLQWTEEGRNLERQSRGKKPKEKLSSLVESKNNMIKSSNNTIDQNAKGNRFIDYLLSIGDIKKLITIAKDEKLRYQVLESAKQDVNFFNKLENLKKENNILKQDIQNLLAEIKLLAKIYSTESEDNNLPQFFLRNSLYVYHKGEQVFKYHKKVGFYEKRRDLYSTEFFPGDKDDPSSFMLQDWGLSFGFEICYDHNQKVLSNSRKKNWFWPVNYNIHVVLSDYVNINSNNFCIKDGGYLIHSSTSKEGDKVWSNEKIIYPQSEKTEGEYFLSSYILLN